MNNYKNDELTTANPMRCYACNNISDSMYSVPKPGSTTERVNLCSKCYKFHLKHEKPTIITDSLRSSVIDNIDNIDNTQYYDKYGTGPELEEALKKAGNARFLKYIIDQHEITAYQIARTIITELITSEKEINWILTAAQTKLKRLERIPKQFKLPTNKPDETITKDITEDFAITNLESIIKEAFQEAKNPLMNYRYKVKDGDIIITKTEMKWKVSAEYKPKGLTVNTTLITESYDELKLALARAMHKLPPKEADDKPVITGSGGFPLTGFKKVITKETNPDELTKEEKGYIHTAMKGLEKEDNRYMAISLEERRIIREIKRKMMR